MDVPTVAESVLREANEEFEQRTRFHSRGLSLEVLLNRVSEYFAADVDLVKSTSKLPLIATARSVLCYLAVRRLRMNGTELARMLTISQSAVSKASARGQGIVRNEDGIDALIET
ncbi:MAG: hypothetical protein V1753_06975 [Pseudomonadota bacterium]